MNSGIPERLRLPKFQGALAVQGGNRREEDCLQFLWK